MSNFTELVKDTLDHIRFSYKKDSTIFVSDALHEYFHKTAQIQRPNATEKKVAQQQPSYAAKPSFAMRPEAKSIKSDVLRGPIQAPSASAAREKKEEPKLTLPSTELKGYIFSEEMKRKIQKTLPAVKIIAEVPDDSAAKRPGDTWKEPSARKAVILYFEEAGPSLSFLENVCKAINERLIPCSLIRYTSQDAPKDAGTLFLAPTKEFIIASNSIYQSNTLSAHIKKDQSTGLFMLGSNPLFILDGLETYSNDPSKKKDLWNKLCQMLRP